MTEIRLRDKEERDADVRRNVDEKKKSYGMENASSIVFTKVTVSIQNVIHFSWSRSFRYQHCCNARQSNLNAKNHVSVLSDSEPMITSIVLDYPAI